MLEFDSPVEGVHKNVFPVLLVVVNVTDEPLHSEVSFRVLTSGNESMIITTESCEVQPLALVAVIKYFVEATGEATGFRA